MALSGLLVVCRALRLDAPYPSMLAALPLGTAAVVSRLLPSWLGALLLVGGLLSFVLGISVGYEGLESGLQDAVVLAFIIGVLVVAWRSRGRATP